MTDNVKPIRPDVDVAEGETLAVDNDVIECLEFLLRAAKEGALHKMGYFAVEIRDDICKELYYGVSGGVEAPLVVDLVIQAGMGVLSKGMAETSPLMDCFYKDFD